MPRLATTALLAAVCLLALLVDPAMSFVRTSTRLAAAARAGFVGPASRAAVRRLGLIEMLRWLLCWDGMDVVAWSAKRSRREQQKRIHARAVCPSPCVPQVTTAT